MSPRDTTTTAQTAADDNIRIERYDIDAVRERFPTWDDWPRSARKTYLQGAEPVHVGTSSNVTTDLLHEYYATLLTIEPADTDLLDPPAEIAFGSDDTSFATTDTSMNNEVGSRLPITDKTSSAKDFEIDEFLSSNEQNGNTIAEVGVFSEDGDMLQHGPTSTTYNKTSSFALLINITISHSDV